MKWILNHVYACDCLLFKVVKSRKHAFIPKTDKLLLIFHQTRIATQRLIWDQLFLEIVLIFFANSAWTGVFLRCPNVSN